MALPSKLFQLKKYLSIDETAKLLTISLGEPINSIDVLDLILGNHILAKVKATHSKVKAILFSVHEPSVTMGSAVKIYESATNDEIIDDVKCGEDFTSNIKLKGYKYFIVNLRLNDYWQFPMIGGNRLAIENYKRKLSGQLLVDSFDGFIYLKGLNGYCKLYELKKEKELIKIINERAEYNIDNYIPVTEINNDIELVIATEEIKKFEQSLLENEDEIDFEQSKQLLGLILKALKEKGSKSWSQDDLSTYISEELTHYGLGKTKINKFFAQCNKLIKSNK